MVLDRAMREELPPPAPQRGLGAAAQASGDDKKRDGRGRNGPQDGQLERRGLLGTKTRGMLVLTCKMLERAERWAGNGSATSPPSFATSSSSSSSSSASSSAPYGASPNGAGSAASSARR